MDKLLLTLKSNVQLAVTAGKASEDILKGQIEELVFCLKDDLLTYRDALRYFSYVFNYPALSTEFYSFCEALSMSGLLKSAENTDLNLNRKISLLENSYSKAALKSFEYYFRSSSEVETETDFNSVCESAYSGRSTFALLPLYNTSDGLMISFYRLLLRYDLKVIAGNSVLMNDGISETKFFLVSHEKFDLTNVDHIMLDVTLPYDGSIHKFLYIVSEFGVVVKSVNTLPLEYTDERSEHVVLLDVSNADINALRCFIHSALDDAAIIGAFPLVK